ncbi:hypothetical protein HN858_04285 [Candidatus Falkowbacteria bacterium]|jgi:hypothetical protein|nr:hypothetical protein [Candidatus Falkowbacteria bacterium]MBT5502837.1 hypothetical protein [Candidatus Falkowbacteria bacterium]MBT6573556.1 hypothetical protein [Candidatus Falkowbacteria bacterium]MBT7348864.1 hypothetical protein [Candidatus Falkowbacteria bacterium]MBT7501015.1 hypothetical protein [Candidatus Falkowbacteria bacterium]
MGKVAQRLEQKREKLNQRLAHLGVPFVLPRVGNYKEGELEIEDILTVFHRRDFVVTVEFLVRKPFSGEKVAYVANFNANYSHIAKSGHVLIPVVNGDSFLMINSYSPFVGKMAIVFPRSFIPADIEISCMEDVSKAVWARKCDLLSQKFDCQTEFLDLRTEVTENHTVSGNVLTYSLVKVQLDEAKFLNEYTGALRVFRLIDKQRFIQLIQQGKIHDQHSLTAWAVYQASTGNCIS